MQTIATIPDGQCIEFREDVHITGNIGQHAVVTVLGGFLHVDGDVGAHTTITISFPSTPSTSMAIGKLIRIEDSLLIKGNVGAHAHINTQDRDIVIEGNIGPKAIIKTTGGDITVKNVAEDAVLTTDSGDIKAHDIAAGAKLSSTTGDITFHEKEDSATVETTGTKTSTKTFAGAGASFFTGGGGAGSSAGGGSWASAAEVRSDSSDELTPELKTYLATFEESEPFSEIFERLGISVEPALCCPISLDIPNKPVMLDTIIFDFDSLMGIAIDPSVGARIHPVTRRPFSLKDIQPASDKKREFESIVHTRKTLAMKSHR